MMAEDMAEKKLRGSGGYAIARITDEEQKKGNLGGPELFLAGIGRLDEDRFTKYYCNKCEKDYEGSPAVVYENPNEELGEGVTLVEKGEYKCKTCNSTIAQYRKFDAPAQQTQQQQQAPAQVQPARTEEPVTSPDIVVAPTTTAPTASESYVPIQSLVGMSAYDGEAMLLGKVAEIGLKKAGANAQITIKVGDKEIPWDGISKIGDIVLLKSANEARQAPAAGGKCRACGFQNEADSAFCAECGATLS
jgi:sporulation protein YlmC with PRC-barrel domain